MEQYKLPSHNNPDKVFIVNRSELEGRIEPLFYQPSCKISNDIKVKFTTLSRCTKTIVHPPEYPREFSDSGFQLIRSQNVRPLGLSLEENPVYFSTDFLSDKKIILAQKGDLLVVRSGVNAGDTAVVEEDYSNIIVGADTLLCKAIPTINPKFIQVYFYTNFGKTQIIKHTTGATNKHLNSENLAKVLIPVVGSNIQVDCVKLFEDSLNLKQQKEAQAKALLDSIDSYLLGELGMTLPEKDNSLQKRVFTSRFSEITGGRLDPFYNEIFYKKIIKQIDECNYPTNKIQELVYSVSGVVYSSEDETTTGLAILRANNISLENNELNFESIRYIKDDIQLSENLKLRQDDILMCSASGSKEHVGKVAFIENNMDYYFGGFMMVLRQKSKDSAPRFLFEFLQSTFFRMYLFRNLGGTNINNLNFNMLRRLQIPLPPLEKQNEIAQHIQSIREQAKQLQNDAKAILEQAKKEIELMILG